MEPVELPEQVATTVGVVIEIANGVPMLTIVV
jgi:hypothetical protein